MACRKETGASVGSEGDQVRDGLEALVGELRRERGEALADVESLRLDVRDAVAPTIHALDSIRDAATYADGLRVGVALASPDGAFAGNLTTHYMDLTSAMNELECVVSQLEDIANGGGGDD